MPITRSLLPAADLDAQVEVWPLAGLDRALTYAVPPRLQGQVSLGSLVRVPLGGRTVLGIVRGALTPPFPEVPGLKLVIENLYPEPVLTPALLGVADWLGRYYAAGPQSVLEAMVPAVVRQGVAPKERKLLKIGYPLPEGELEALRRKAPKQAALLDFLRQQSQPLPKGEVLERLQVAAASCVTLIQRGLVFEVREVQEREVYLDEWGDGEQVAATPPKLTEEQRTAAAELTTSLHAGGFIAHLLHGVTGSGKTEVYLNLLQTVLAEGGGAIFLVPEVALTPQTVGRVRARLAEGGHRVVVWHSHLSAGERFDAWRAMASGAARVVVGPRSAVFAPIPNLRLIIVDEEHEPSYKQSETPRYHGRDVAIYRAQCEGALCLLGSATPALETLYQVSTGACRVSRLSRRVDDRELPKILLVDMKREKPGPQGGAKLLSVALAERLRDRFEKKEQSILFLNRRGFSSSLLCPSCGHAPGCPHCSVTLTYHRADERLKCHLCGYHQAVPRQCPACHSPDITRRGSGTQRIEDIVKTLLPKARCVRLDADAMTKKHLFRQVLSDFRKGAIDILVGTQMIAKGLDFPNVTLVGLVDADLALQVPDFRAGERAFQLIVQVSGRAGRGDRAGEVVIQTHQPHTDPIQYARRGDFDGFLLAELAERRAYHYPPFRHLIRHLFRSRSLDKLTFYTQRWADFLLEQARLPIEVRGPVPCPLEKMKDLYRFHCCYFVDQAEPAAAEIQRLRDQFPLDPEIQDLLDIDALDLI